MNRKVSTLIFIFLAIWNSKCFAFSVFSMRKKENQWQSRLQLKTTLKQPNDPRPLHDSFLRGFFSSIAVLSLSISLCVAPATAEESVGSSARRYWNSMQHGPKEERIVANEALVDHAIGTVNTMYYDNSGGVTFQPRDFYNVWRDVKDIIHTGHSKYTAKRDIPADINMDTREGCVKAIRYMLSTLHDPFSSYLTREELRQELQTSSNGFLGLGAIVEAPNRAHVPLPMITTLPFLQNKIFLSATQIANLPIVSAVAPDSPAERAGFVVGDRIVAVGTDKFLGATVNSVSKALDTRYSAENYAGYPDLTVAKPVWASVIGTPGDVVVGYRTSHVRLPTTSLAPFRAHDQVKGDAIVHYELLTSKESILDQSSSLVGYIRLTRFSRAATTGFINAIQELDAAGAQSYIIDIRNNYGGVIQEAMLTASTLLRDPHAVLCYTMNSRGGFTPHDAEEYIVDSRFPGYLLSKESTMVTRDQVKRESPEMFQGSGIAWVPPSSYASLHEQRTKRGIKMGVEMRAVVNHPELQKQIVLLVNEGTASSAEVFASSLHDNGRTVALVGTKTYGKGLIQHTFPMPDGGGLRLTVAEYLTPNLQHVTNVGSARFDRETGEFVGGGIRPDIICDSTQGIPSNAGADLCVAIALDALDDADMVSDKARLY